MATRKPLLIYSILMSINCFGQEEQEEKSFFDLTGYVEVYYLYDFSRPEDHTRPPFIYSYNRTNEFNLNLGFLKGAYTAKNIRGNLAFMAGTYANANLRNEPGVLKNVFEANAGVKLSGERDIWVDAGILPSHIGFESAVGKENWNLTRSLLADNSPYYESGGRISYNTSNGKWFLSGLILNGWQRIQMVNGNTLPSIGTQFTFRPSPKITLNSSTFAGTDKPDNARLMRYFHNFYGIFQLSEKAGLTVGFDYGAEERSVSTNDLNIWYSPVGILRLKINDRFMTAFRAEYYSDKSGVIVNSPAGAEIAGISFNVDYQINLNALWRIEVRNFSASDDIFEKNGQPVNRNTIVSTALAVSF